MMRVRVSRDKLLEAIQHVSKAVAAHSPVPILSGILLKAGSDKLVLTASNMSLSIQYTIERECDVLEIERAGSIVVSARYVYEIVRKLDAGTVVLDESDNRLLSLTAGHAHIRLCGMDPLEFPAARPEAAQSPARLTIRTALLKAAVKQVAAAASTSEARPVLTGISVRWSAESLQLAATDSIRLALRVLPIESVGADQGGHVVIPAKNLLEIAKMLDERVETTELAVSSGHIRMTTKQLEAQSALIEGAYPSIQHVIPQSWLSEAAVETVGLVKAVERASVLAGEHIMKLTATERAMEVLSRTAEIGDMQDETAIRRMSGDPFAVTLNGRMLAELLRHMEGECLRLQYTGKASPVIIRPENGSDSALFLITPVRTAEDRAINRG